jgi:hypothetical protein
MSFTVLFALFALLVLIVVFGLAYKIRGLKTALILTAAAFVVFAVLFVGLIYVITNAMN